MTRRSKLREKIITLTERKLNSEFPRLQISLILVITALSGFFTSFILLQIGIYSMAFRYFISVVVAYSAFLLLLRIWIWMQKGQQIDFDLDLEGVDLSAVTFSSSSSSSSDTDFEFGGGGDFSGGGSGGSWDENDAPAPSFGIASTTSTKGGKSGGGGVTSILDSADGDDLLWIILAAIALLAAFIAAFWVIYIAPTLLAEIFVDGVLVTGIYSRVKKMERKYWLTTAVKKTILPAVIIAICFGIAGFALQEAAPEARSIGEFWNYDPNYE